MAFFHLGGKERKGKGLALSLYLAKWLVSIWIIE